MRLQKEKNRKNKSSNLCRANLIKTTKRIPNRPKVKKQLVLEFALCFEFN